MKKDTRIISNNPPAEDADDLKQYMTNLLYSAYDKGVERQNINDLDQWVEEMTNGIDEYFKSKQLTAEGAEEILKRHCKENKIILTSNDFHTWLNAINEIATLHAQRLAEKMVEEKLKYNKVIQQRDELKEALAEMIWQFGYRSTYEGRESLHTGGLSALESAFGALGLSDPIALLDFEAAIKNTDG